MRFMMGAALLLCACSNKSEQAEKRYDIVKKTGSAKDICDQGQLVLGIVDKG